MILIGQIQYRLNVLSKANYSKINNLSKSLSFYKLISEQNKKEFEENKPILKQNFR